MARQLSGPTAKEGEMRNSKETPSLSRARVWFVFALFLVLMVLAHGAAELQARLNARAGLSVDH